MTQDELDLGQAVPGNTERVLTAREKLNSVLDRETPRSSESSPTTPTTLEQLATRIENGHKATLLGTFEDEDASESISKWYTAYKPKGDEVRTPPTVHRVRDQTETLRYIVVESTLYSRRKQQTGEDDDGSYTAVWLLGETEDAPRDPDDFWIHRFEWDSTFEDDRPWTVSRIQEKLGFSERLAPDETPEYETTYQVVGDITLEVVPLEDQIARYVNRKAKQHRRDIVSNKKEQVAHELFGQYDEIRITGTTRTRRLRVRPDSTDDLKQLQSKLGIAEETVRARMDEDWQRLTASRRQTIIERYLNSLLPSEGDLSVDEETARKRARAEVEDSLSGSIQYYQLENHLVVIGSATESVPFRSNSDGLIVAHCPTATEVRFEHDEHETRTITVPRGTISIGLTPRHQQA